jgi:hypothetical protein
MFKPLDKRRLLELAGINPVQHGPEDRSMSASHQETDSDAGLHGEHPTGGDDTEEHLDKETSVFSKVHDALEELLDFLKSQEGFEEKRGKEDEYSQMEHDAEDLRNAMKKHLSGYKDEEGSEDGEPEEDIKMVKPNKMSFR